MMNSTTPSRSSRSRALPALALGASLILAPLGAAHAETTPATTESASAQPSDSNLSRGERALTQTLSAEQPVASGRTEISAGHVDMGPRFNNGKFELMLHDDHGESPVWRSLDEVIYRGSDQAILEVPNDPRYSFVGAPARTWRTATSRHRRCCGPRPRVSRRSCGLRRTLTPTQTGCSPPPASTC